MSGTGIFFDRRKGESNDFSEDSELAFKAANGDEKAFEVLIKKYERLVGTGVYSVVGNNPEDIMDISQEAFLKAYRSLSSFKGESEFSTWLYRIAKNCALDYVRKRKMPSLSLDTGGDDGERIEIQAGEDVANPEKTALDNEKTEILNRSISLLSPEHREVIVLRHINGYTYEQIADALSVEVGTVKSRISRARVALKKILEKENYF